MIGISDHEVKELIVEALMLEDVTAEDIDNDSALFGEGLGLDSIDALELGMAISKKYKIKLSQDPDENREHFASVKSLVAFIDEKVRANQECHS
jgi:acyl carrier protein